jgi:succinyl-CoA:acetate CoA-transferase
MRKKRNECEKLRAKVTSAEAAAKLITSGSTVGMSGFTGSGYPKAVRLALAARISKEHAAGNPPPARPQRQQWQGRLRRTLAHWPMQK